MLHLVLGFLTIARSDEPALLYVGKDADAALQSAKKAVENKTHRVVDRFLVASPITMYADVEADIVVVQAVPVDAVNPVNLIQLQDGEHTLSLISEEDAARVRAMIAVRENEQALAARIIELERALNAEARRAAKDLRTKATQLNQAAVDARLAADASKGKSNHKKLEEAADAALDAAKQAESDADEAEARLKE